MAFRSWAAQIYRNGIVVQNMQHGSRRSLLQLYGSTLQGMLYTPCGLNLAAPQVCGESCPMIFNVEGKAKKCGVPCTLNCGETYTPLYLARLRTRLASRNCKD